MPGMQKDDVVDDARAAYNEVAGKVEAAPPSSPEPELIGQNSPNLEAEPAEKPESAETKPETNADGTNRDPKGRFAPKTAKSEEGKQTQEKPADKATEAQPPPGPQSTVAAPVGGPPTSWTIKSKAAWDALPEAVRADIVKREGEVAQGLSALRDFKDLKPYAERAQREGTTIKGALDHYVKLEDLIRRDLGAGLAQIAQNYGLNAQQAAQVFAGLAQRFGGSQAPPPQGGSPAGGLPPATDPLMQALAPVIDPLLGEVRTLKQQLQARDTADRNAQTQSLEKALAKFQADPQNRYYADLEEQIVSLFENGHVPKTGNWETDLRTAYDLAARMHPEVSEALIEQRLAERLSSERKREQEAADKAKAASRSITGAAAPGTIIQDRPRSNGHDDIHADVLAAYRQHAQH